MAVAAYFELEEGTVPATPTTGKWRVYFKSGGFYIVDDTGTETNIASLEGTAELNINASQMYPSTTGGCAALAQVEYGTNDVDVNVLDFDQSTQEYAQFGVWLPDTYGGGTMTAEFTWTASGSPTTFDVIWAIQGRSFANDDAIDQAWGTAQTVTDTLTAVGDICITSATSAMTLAGSPAGGQFAMFRVYRDADDGSDTLDVDARLIAVKLTYTKGV